MPVKRRAHQQVCGPCRFDAIVLAAGAGTRFGGGKLSAPWRDGVLLDSALLAAFEAPALRVIVVTGSDPGVAGIAQAFATRRGDASRLALVAAQGWAQGLSASLRAGLAEVSPDCDGAFVFLGDMPAIPPGLTQRMAEAFGPGVAAVAPVLDGTPGHPTLIGRALFAEVMRLEGDQGARALMEAQGPRFVRLPVQAAGVLLDVDTREVLEALDPPGGALPAIRNG